MIKELAVGFCLGAANIIPGVSGGTFLLIFNLYERVFAVLRALNGTLAAGLISRAAGVIKNPFNPGRITLFTDFLRQHDLLFLLKLVAGAAIAIVTLSGLMKYLLLNHFFPTYSFFFGLIFVSIIIPVRMIKNRRPALVLFILAGAALTVLLSCSVDPYAKALRKSALYEKQHTKPYAEQTPASSGSRFFSFSGKYSPAEYLYIGLCGALGVSAMVLPGISGSLVLILMGEYYTVIEAITGLATLNIDHIFFLGAFSIGMIIGILLFSRVVSFFFAAYYNMTVAFLIGLMAGSLYSLWPFKKSLTIAEQYVKTDGIITVIENAPVYSNINILPATPGEMIVSLIFFSAGCAVMAVFVRKDRPR